MQQRHEDIDDAGALLLAISPMRLSLTTAFADKLRLSFPVLSDTGNTIAAKYGLVITVDEALRPIYSDLGIDLAAANGDTSHRLPLPATYIIDRDGTIVYRYADADYTDRLDPQRVIEEVQRL